MRAYVHTVTAHVFGSDAAGTGKCYGATEVATRFSEHLDGGTCNPPGSSGPGFVPIETIARSDHSNRAGYPCHKSLGGGWPGYGLSEKIAKLVIASAAAAISSLKPPPLFQRDCHVATLLAMTEGRDWSFAIFSLSENIWREWEYSIYTSGSSVPTLSLRARTRSGGWQSR